MEYEGDGDTYSSCALENDPQRIDKGIAGLGNQRTSRDHPDYSIAKIGQNTKKSYGDLRRLTVTQTPVKHHKDQSY